MFFSLYKDKFESTIDNHVFTALWYIIFIFLIPYFIKSMYSFDMLRFYLPVLDLIANIFASSGSFDRIFKDLYSLSPHNIVSFLSTNFINLVALVGVSWNGILHAFKRKNLWVGVTVTIFMYLITYLIPTQMIPYVIGHVHGKYDKYIPHLHVTVMNTKIHLEDYLAGVVLIGLLVFIEFLLISEYINLLKYF